MEIFDSLQVIITFVIDNWLMVAIIGLAIVFLLKKMKRITRRAVRLVYTLQGVVAGLGIIKEIIDMFF